MGVTVLHVEEVALWREALGTRLPGEVLLTPQEAASCVADVDVAVVEAAAEGLDRYPNLEFVQSLWAGVDRLLADPTLPRQVTVARMVSPELTQLMAEYVLAAVLHVHRQVPTYAAQQRAGRWHPLEQRTAADTPVGMLGAGELASASASLLRAVGFPVTSWARRARAHDPSVLCGMDGLRSLLLSSHVVVNLLPLTPAVRHVIDATSLAWFRPGAAFVNPGRGGHVHEAALLDALDRGQLSHAVLDVFETEPLPAASPLWSHPNVTVTPHVAASSTTAAVADVAAAAIAARRRGVALVDLPNVVDRVAGY